MEEKKNESTSLRPEGERFLNASLVEMDIEKYIDQLKEEVTWKASGSNSITLFKSDALRIVLIGLHKDAERSEEHTSELQSRGHLVCRLLIENKKLYQILILTRKKKDSN